MLVLLGALIVGYSRNPDQTSIIPICYFRFALTEAVGLLGLMYVILNYLDNKFIFII